jgi:hypothetical protein
VALSLLEHNAQNYGGGVNNIVTGSVPAGTGPYVLCLVGQGDQTGFTVTGCGLTWTLVDFFAITSILHIAIYKGTGTPTTGAITAVPVGAGFNNREAWSVTDVPGLTSITNISHGTNSDWASVGCTITGTPIGSDICFAIADSGRDLSGPLTSWSSGWATIGAAEDNLNSVGEIVTGQSVTNNQSPTANFTGSGGATGGIIGCILVGAAGGGGGGGSLPPHNITVTRQAVQIGGLR